MSYKYPEQRERLFTDEGQRHFLKVRDKAKRLLESAGAFMGPSAWEPGDAWLSQACLDRMVELGELRCLNQGPGTWQQHQVYSFKNPHHR